MVRSVVFFSVIFLISAVLALLYTFGFLRLFFLILGATTLSIVYLLFHPRNQWLVANRSRVAGGRCVALTFDDGPDPVDTPRLLDLLREKDVKATFFVIGQRADQHPEVVRRAWAEGHLIGNHTWSHYPLFCFLMPGRLRAEIERCTESIGRICGFRPRLFRSPVGLRHPLLAPYLDNAGLEYISWRIRTRDTLTANSSVLARRILSKAASGDIILLHDRLPGGTDAMLEALPRVIDELRERGFQFVLAGPREDAGGTLQSTACESAP
ncbi:MAG TPA: polysaccharide deacetylase family protein [Candidatus Sulfotelmatobacter sp.]|nr:polysaccharide deacetylase family protein [Candidatus Sulfotelmatobacter sp.]